MDWYSWLCKTGLEPSLVYEYGLAFAHNELEYEDITYFNHEFLQSIGISIGKHRLEILKLAKKERGAIPNSMSRFLQLINRTKRRFSKYIRNLGHKEELALALVPKRNCSSRWKNAMLKRNKRVAAAKQTTLLLTNGSPIFMSDLRMNSFSSPMLYDDFPADEKVGADYWTSSAVEEIRWDAMFQNMKPT
ncbi:uncharacterized protein [Nicotiana tomentosiformis]|uniref:uncharacterized protein n=1 Tax=Nicotiana tomentosiformis TaxID=4098 RepID=UPI00051B318A|nr:uncharacterized protein LOC104104852 [Nicotiana tomentosiformis]